MVTELRKCCAFEANILQYDREDDKTRFECEDLILCFWMKRWKFLPRVSHPHKLLRSKRSYARIINQLNKRER